MIEQSAYLLLIRTFSTSSFSHVPMTKLLYIGFWPFLHLKIFLLSYLLFRVIAKTSLRLHRILISVGSSYIVHGAKNYSSVSA